MKAKNPDMTDRELRLIVGVNAAICALAKTLSDSGHLQLGALYRTAQLMLANAAQDGRPLDTLKTAPLSALCDYARNYGGLKPPMG